MAPSPPSLGGPPILPPSAATAPTPAPALSVGPTMKAETAPSAFLPTGRPLPLPPSLRTHRQEPRASCPNPCHRATLGGQHQWSANQSRTFDSACIAKEPKRTSLE